MAIMKNPAPSVLLQRLLMLLSCVLHYTCFGITQTTINCLIIKNYNIMKTLKKLIIRLNNNEWLKLFLTQMMLLFLYTASFVIVTPLRNFLLSIGDPNIVTVMIAIGLIYLSLASIVIMLMLIFCPIIGKIRSFFSKKSADIITWANK